MVPRRKYCGGRINFAIRLITFLQFVRFFDDNSAIELLCCMQVSFSQFILNVKKYRKKGKKQTTNI